MNGEGYPDPTADKAVTHFMKSQERITTGYVPPDVYRITKPVLQTLSMMGYDTTVTIEDSDGKIYAVRMKK